MAQQYKTLIQINHESKLLGDEENKRLFVLIGNRCVECTAGLNLASDEEPRTFRKSQEKLNHRRARRHGSVSSLSSVTDMSSTTKKKDKKRKKLTKTDIGAPSDFRHVGHVGWDSDKGAFKIWGSASVMSVDPSKYEPAIRYSWRQVLDKIPRGFSLKQVDATERPRALANRAKHIQSDDDDEEDDDDDDDDDWSD